MKEIVQGISGLFKAACVIMFVISALELVALTWALAHPELITQQGNVSNLFIYSSDAKTEILWSTVSVLAQCIAQCAAGVVGLLAIRGKVPSVSAEAAAIVVAGVAIATTIMRAVISGFDNDLLVYLVISLVAPFVYGVGLLRSLRDNFWKDIKLGDVVIEPGLQFDDRAGLEMDLPKYYAIKPEGLVEVASADEANVRIVGFDDVGTDEWALRLLLDRFGHLLARDRADVFDNVVAGTVAMPRCLLMGRYSGRADDVIGAFWRIDGNDLLFATKDPLFADFFHDFAQDSSPRRNTSALVLEGLYDYSLRGAGRYIDTLEERLKKLEDNIVTQINEVPQDFEEYAYNMRRSLRELSRNFTQSGAACKMLSEAQTCIGEFERRAFGMFEGRFKRLSIYIQDDNEYLQQIQHLYQSKVQNKSNRIMELLTIFAAIFLPLSLIATWYGMNLDFIPERHMEYTYPIVVIIAILLVTLEFVIFKRKKWL